MEISSPDVESQFTSSELKEECQTRVVHLMLVTPEHQEMNRQVKVTWRMLLIIAHSLMVYAIVSKAYIHFEFMCTTENIFAVLPIKYLINEDGETTMQIKLATGTKPSVLYSCMIFCPCVVRKATAHTDKKVLNICHQAKEVFPRYPHWYSTESKRISCVRTKYK